ncbi:NHLP-related RiPP peptide [Massilia glaciei]|uniref:Putative modified peptide n=1 Tax=Massilia glaciei TaxID=1524097 RepID=A0A2U2HML1_9BURK|nr:NHLP-related RiPP peptide [Massilia glaciei]PWF48655.1 putative modified peptide [Massilia glaciei]
MAMNSPEDIDRLLKKLATDDAFRELMQSDPVKAMDSIGITVDPADVPDVRTLPSKESIAADQDAHREKLVGNSEMDVFKLSGLV